MGGACCQNTEMVQEEVPRQRSGWTKWSGSNNNWGGARLERRFHGPSYLAKYSESGLISNLEWIRFCFDWFLRAAWAKVAVEAKFTVVYTLRNVFYLDNSCDIPNLLVVIRESAEDVTVSVQANAPLTCIRRRSASCYLVLCIIIAVSVSITNSCFCQYTAVTVIFRQANTATTKNCPH